MNLLRWIQGKTTKPKSAPAAPPEPPPREQRPRLERSPSANVWQPDVAVVTDSRWTTRPGRDSYGPTIVEVRIQPDPAPEPTGGKHDFRIVGGGGRRCVHCGYQPDIPATPAEVIASRPAGSFGRDPYISRWSRR